MAERSVEEARRFLAASLHGLAEPDLVRAARTAVARLGTPERLLDLVRELTSGAADPASRALLSYRHVLGFDKLLLIDGGPEHMLRAHVWRPDARAAGREDIHNHRSPLASYVALGSLGMELYETVERASEGEIAASWYRESLSERRGDWLLEPAGPAYLRLTQIGEYAAGSGYALPAYALHRAWCASAGPAVTLFLETGARRRQYTDVFTGAGAPHARAAAVPKTPLSVDEYLAELETLAKLIGG